MNFVGGKKYTETEYLENYRNGFGCSKMVLDHFFLLALKMASPKTKNLQKNDIFHIFIKSRQ